jgi:hypothetical protein
MLSEPPPTGQEENVSSQQQQLHVQCCRIVVLYDGGGGERGKKAAIPKERGYIQFPGSHHSAKGKAEKEKGSLFSSTADPLIYLI